MIKFGYGHRHLDKGEILSTEEFITKAKTIHGDLYDYSETMYNGRKEKIIFKCSIHGEMYQDPCDHLSGHGCKRCFFDSLKTWTGAEDKWLIENYKKLGAYKCAEFLKKSDHAIRGRAQVLSISRKQNKTHKFIPAAFWGRLLARVKKKNFALDIDQDFIYALYIKQDGKCALTGWPIAFSNILKDNTASLDRIDSSRGYLKDNVQLTHKIVNKCKLNTKETDFYKICRAITDHRKDLMIKKLNWEWDVFNDTEYSISTKEEFIDS